MKNINFLKNLPKLIPEIIKPENIRFVLLASLILLLLFNLFLLWWYFRKRKKGTGLEIYKKSFVQKFKHLFVNLLLVSISAVSLSVIVFPQPAVAFPTEPSLGLTEVSPENPVRIEFNRPVNIDNLKIDITPEIKGNWEYVNEDYKLVPNALYFYPEETLDPDTQYVISISGISNILGTSQNENYLFSFQTPPLPKIESIIPKNNDAGVLPGQEIIVKLDRAPGKNCEFTFSIYPEVDLEINLNDSIYNIKPKEPLEKGTKYIFKVARSFIRYNFEKEEVVFREEEKQIAKSQFKVIDAPGVKSYTPTGSGILTNVPVKIEFKQDMDKNSTQSAFQINPQVSGSFSWEGKRKLTFTPKSLNKNTTYTVSVNTQAKATDQSPLKETFKFKFTTIGYVIVTGFSPGNGASTGSNIYVYFNQAVDHASAQAHFSISPGISGSFSWSGNKMIFNPRGSLGYNATYTISVSKGVKSIYGLDSISNFSESMASSRSSFTLSKSSPKRLISFSRSLSFSSNSSSFFTFIFLTSWTSFYLFIKFY